MAPSRRSTISRKSRGSTQRPSTRARIASSSDLIVFEASWLRGICRSPLLDACPVLHRETRACRRLLPRRGRQPGADGAKIVASQPITPLFSSLPASPSAKPARLALLALEGCPWAQYGLGNEANSSRLF